jgi:hypothetical protein
MASDVLAILWFDTEDFITPESDEIPMRIAQLMDQHGLKVTFKVVGEKLRALEKRKRWDVIQALAKHDIGYHSNLHSVHPTISQYVDNLEWDAGISEFENREFPGIEQIRRVFSKNPSCYGHPGLQWVPEAYPVLRKWNIPVYLDNTFTLTPLKERPFWYCNTLNIMCLGPNILSMNASDGPGNLPDDHLIELRAKFVKVYEDLAASDELGIISLFCHPTTYSTFDFWDKLNYSGGENPPHDKVLQPKVKMKSRIATDLENLDSFVALAKSMKKIHFITASDAVELYHDKARDREFNVAELRSLCKRSLRGINYQPISPDVWLSPAEIFSIVLASLVHYSKKKVLPGGVRIIQPYGPKADNQSKCDDGEVDLDVFLQECSRVLEKVRLSSQLPSTVYLAKSHVSPADMFATCCEIYVRLSNDETIDIVALKKGNFEVGKHVTEKGARTDWKLTYTNPEGFEATKQIEIARLQTWTLKPAVLNLSQLRAMSKNRSSPQPVLS